MPKVESILLFASHDFAIPLLEALVDAGRGPQALVAQPPVEPEPFAPPQDPVTADWAIENGLPVLQPDTLPAPAVAERLAAVDLAVVAGYGALPPVDWLRVPARGFLQVQPSLLPKYRGETAVRAVLDEGEKKTGVTVIRMDEEPYGGEVLAQEEIEITPSETYGHLMPRLGEVAGRLLLATLDRLDQGEPKGKKQNEKIATTAPAYGKRHDKTPWSLDAEQIFNRLRAYSPTPGLKAFLRRRPIRITSGQPLPWVNAPYGEVGTFLGLRQGRLAVLCGGNSVFGIERLAWRGGEETAAGDFARREELRVGDTFV